MNLTESGRVNSAMAPRMEAGILGEARGHKSVRVQKKVGGGGNHTGRARNRIERMAQLAMFGDKETNLFERMLRGLEG
jgi:hypothetical protein